MESCQVAKGQQRKAVTIYHVYHDFTCDLCQLSVKFFGVCFEAFLYIKMLFMSFLSRLCHVFFFTMNAVSIWGYRDIYWCVDYEMGVCKLTVATMLHKI